MKMSLLNSVMRRAGGGAAVALLAAGVLGSAPAQAALTGIAATKHNLSTSNSIADANKLATGATSTTEICVFCHTPHGSDTSASVPLWNKKMATSTYSTYNSLGTSSLDGNVLGVGSVSMACLSCHDGSQALNVMINQPGSGGFVSGGAEFGTMSGTADRLSGNKLATNSIANIGVDLKNDHPVGIQYGGGPKVLDTIPAAGTAYSNTLFRDADFKSALSASANSMTVWWVETGSNTTREKTDMQLYTRTGKQLGDATGSEIAQPYVECASCHDPHSINTTFLRIDNSASAVCLACHTK